MFFKRSNFSTLVHIMILNLSGGSFVVQQYKLITIKDGLPLCFHAFKPVGNSFHVRKQTNLYRLSGHMRTSRLTCMVTKSQNHDAASSITGKASLQGLNCLNKQYGE